MKDFSYSEQGMFTLFLPNTPEAVDAWNQLAEVTDGTGKVFNHHAKSIIAQLKKAGYSVGKAKPVTMSIDDIFNELEG
jgi:hypothetical protein